MRRELFLEVQLRQAEAALETTRRMKELAEAQYRQVLELLRKIVVSVLAPEWNGLISDHPEAREWSPETLTNWVIESLRAKMNRLELLAGGATAGNVETEAEVRRLQEEIRRLDAERQALLERVGVLQEEKRHLEQRVKELEQSRSEPGPGDRQPIHACEGDEEVTRWLQEADDSERELLRIIGAVGFSLRDELVRAAGKSSARSGGAVDLFQRLIADGLIAEEPLRSEAGGRAPNVVRLTAKGRSAYRVLTGNEPVESEFDRLLRRHKSPEQVLLALRARQVLESAGAVVNLFPDPVPLEGGFFEVDLVATLDGQELLVECERASSSRPRMDKWSAYARATKDFCFFVPNKEVFGRLTTELNLWAYRHMDEAQGIVVRIHQLSSREEGKLWHYVRPLAGTLKK